MAVCDDRLSVRFVESVTAAGPVATQRAGRITPYSTRCCLLEEFRQEGSLAVRSSILIALNLEGLDGA
jgi:hypothetical protein